MGQTVTSVADHLRLSCGIDLAVLPMPERGVAAMELRVLGGFAFETPEVLGVTGILEEAISKGTAQRDGRALNDAFDEIGAAHSSYAGRESVAFSCLCLPEFIERAIDLHAEMIRTPTFPIEACEVAAELAMQSLAALKDDPQELAKRILCAQAYGEPLGRHVLGEMGTLESIGRDEILAHWSQNFASARMLVAVAGPVEASWIADLLEARFTGFGQALRPEPFELRFTPTRSHHAKELEQVQVGICFPGVSVRDADFSIEQVTIGVLAGGMSGRLFTEVREKQGLVYSVGAWSDQPRRGGMVHVGASCTPENLERTYGTLLRELDRVAEDVTQAEIDRAITGIVTRTRTRGEVTRAKSGELIDDLFYYDHPVPTEEKLAKVQAVRVADVCRYLREHPREALSVVTLGPKGL